MTAPSELAAGTYEVLRNRLREAAGDLRERIDRLNAARADVFGNIETHLKATERVTTEHNCVPRDLTALGDHFLFGYNVQFGLKTETELADVFGVYRFDEGEFHAESLDLIGDERFVRDFAELYRYYKGTALAKFFYEGPFLHMVFRVGKTWHDIKTFKWRVAEGSLEYIDNRSEHEVRYPSQHEFQWRRTSREQHLYGDHPHISIEDRVFVETVGGDLTIKVENNTASGEGIYAEPVDNRDQTLDDAEIYYAVVGNLVLLKIRPYQERDFRYLLFNGKLQKAMRIDAIAHACVLLPDDQGIIFPGGYYLQTGEFKLFDHGLSELVYERTIAAPNGEDFLYLFYNHEAGAYIQLRYNLIRQQVDTPLVCHGQAFFSDGKMICFRSQDEPQKHHAIQIWQTPFVGPDHVPDTDTDSLLFKIGNKDLVRGMAEAAEILQLIDKEDTYEDLYVDLVKKTRDVLDSYFWLDKEETHHLDQPLRTIHETASAAVEEYEKVVRVRRDTAERTASTERAVGELLKHIDRSRFESIDDFVESLAGLREQRGHVIGLRELRYVDVERTEQLETQLVEKSDRLSRRCVDFLLTDDALAPYQRRVAEAGDAVPHVETVAEARQLEERVDEAGSHLELLTETVGNLKIEDATKRTQIIDTISDVFAGLNRVRSSLKARIGELVSVEGRAEFASQMKLLEQTVSGYLDVCDAPEKCDTYVTRVMVQLEELEGRFAEFDEFIEQLTARREEVYDAFESRKVQLVEARNRRAEGLAAAADRILSGIATRARSLDSLDALHAYFASDLMVEKVRGIAEQLQALDDSVRAEDILGRLKTSREEAVRQLKDRKELFEEGGDVIRLGRHRFSVNTQPLELTTVLRDGRLCLHLAGTQFFEPLEHADLEAARDLWDREWISESETVYRGEYLAYQLFEALHRGEGDAAARGPAAFLKLDPEKRVAWVQQRMTGRYAEGYAKGVHDHDAAAILEALLRIDSHIGLLRFRPDVRAAAWFWWSRVLDASVRKPMAAWIGGFAKLASAFPGARPAVEFRQRLVQLMERTGRGDAPTANGKRKAAETASWTEMFGTVRPDEAAAYLFDQLVASPEHPTISRRAVELYEAFGDSLDESERQKLLAAGLKASAGRPDEAWVLARNWAEAFLASHRDTDEAVDPAGGYRDELAWLLIEGGPGLAEIGDAAVATRLTGLAGAHPRISGGAMPLHYHELLERLERHARDVVPRMTRLRETKHRLVEEARQRMRLDEFRPRVLSSFVRNQLLDEVYLPIIGDNLAKQIGAAGEGKRTDRMGLLLVISPPGYGKTTLMEYVANRLGIIFVKVNGPAIGHGVTSLDPAEAPNAAAREEVQRINLALEMGDNVMIYLDDIQHTHPELLQKFISLCDATRKIEGVWKGQTRTYDLRGRRVAVVMAGNPYTESGEKFQIPDMLSNRADVYNLGEIIGDARAAFEMSYLENCLTSNATLAPLASGTPEDARRLIRAAERDSLEGADLEGGWGMDQVREMFEVLRKLLRVRDVVLRVNRQYIRSAAQADAYRTEPPFKLQGSYRNMNRIAERVVPVMNDAELQSLIVGTYEQDSQTLTSDNEANVLKFKELMGILSPAETERWEAIKYAFVESVRFQGVDSEDQLGQLMQQLGSMRDGLEAIRRVIAQAVAAHADDGAAQARMEQQLDELRHVLSGASDRVARSLETTGGRLGALVEQRADAPPEQRVLVQHKVPRVMLEVVKSQFQLMQEWMRPLLSETAQNGQQLEQLQHHVEQALQNYAELRDQLETAAGKRE